MAGRRPRRGGASRSADSLMRAKLAEPAHFATLCSVFTIGRQLSSPLNLP